MAVRKVDDRQLVELHKAGDEEAFTKIVTAYHRELISHARRRLHDPGAAEDAVQEALLRAFRALPRFNGEYKLGAWLHRIVENVCADEGNRRRRQGELTDRVASLPITPEADVADTAIADPDVTQALKSLSPSYREALVLRYVEGLPYREVATKTGVSEENARARAHRGRAVLRKVLHSPNGKGAAALIPALLAWIAAAGRRTRRAIPGAGHPISAVEAAANRAATRLGPATDQLMTASTFQGTGVFSRAAAVVAAVTLPMASAGLGTAIGWLDDDKPARTAAPGAAGEPSDAMGRALSAAMGTVRSAPPTTTGSAAAKPKSAPAPKDESDAPRARANVAGVEGDTERWDWFGQNPNKDPNADRTNGGESEPQGEYVRADAMGASAEAGTTRIYGGGKYQAPDRLVEGQIEAVLRTTDDKTTAATEATRFVLTFTENGGRSQPVRIKLEGAVTTMAEEGELTRYGLSGKWQLRGSGLGVQREGTFTASMVVGSTDVNDLRISLKPDPTP